MTEVFVVPAQGLIVRDPITKRPLPSAGAKVPENTYWLRRIEAGDVLVKPAPAKKESAKPAVAKAKES